MQMLAGAEVEGSCVFGKSTTAVSLGKSRFGVQRQCIGLNEMSPISLKHLDTCSPVGSCSGKFRRCDLDQGSV